MILRRLFRRISLSLIERRVHEWHPQKTAGSTIVFSPHYDDETLGAGGAIIKLRQRGIPVHLVFMTDGSSSHAHAMDGSMLSALRRKEALDAAAVLGVNVDHVRFLEYQETRLTQHRAEAVDRVIELLEELQCERIFVPSTLEPLVWSADHQSTTEIVFEALERTGMRPEIMEYLVWFWYHWPWVPVLRSKDAKQLLKLTWRNCLGIKGLVYLNAAVSITEVWPQKLKALEEYRTQMTRLTTDKPWPILADVAGGDFLQSCFQPREFFKTYIYQSSRQG